MDRQSRRRFIPTSDKLEVRELMTTTSNIFGSPTQNNTLDLALTFQQKEQRIERLPTYVLGLQKNRFVPKSVMSEIQNGLVPMMGQLDKPGTSVLDSFNLTLRKIVPSVSLTQGNARKLHQAFVQVLQAAHAPTGAIDQLANAVNQLATQVDTASIQPVFLATNDYTLVLQTALAIGKPLPIPQVPQVAKNSGIQVSHTQIKTAEARPYLTGNYVRGVSMQIVTGQGEVLGGANTNNAGQYRVRIQTPLAPGTYSLYARVEDQGHYSRLSHVFDVTVVPRKKK